MMNPREVIALSLKDHVSEPRLLAIEIERNLQRNGYVIMEEPNDMARPESRNAWEQKN